MSDKTKREIRNAFVLGTILLVIALAANVASAQYTTLPQQGYILQYQPVLIPGTWQPQIEFRQGLIFRNIYRRRIRWTFVPQQQVRPQYQQPQVQPQREPRLEFEGEGRLKLREP